MSRRRALGMGAFAALGFAAACGGKTTNGGANRPATSAAQAPSNPSPSSAAAATTPGSAGGAATPATGNAQWTNWTWVTAPPATLSQPPRSGGRLREAVSATVPTLDPRLTTSYAMCAAVTPIYNRLVRTKYGAEMLSHFDFLNIDVVGDLAQSWEQPDNQTYTFHINPAAKFQNVAPLNGRQFTANDVKYSLDSYTSTGVLTASFTRISQIAVVDPQTVKVTLKQPFFDFLLNPLSLVNCLMFAHEILEQDGTLEKRAIGTGAFILDQYNPQQLATYNKNPDYFVKGRPYLDGIDYHFIPDNNTLLAGFRAKQFDLPSGLPTKVDDLPSLAKEIGAVVGMSGQQDCEFVIGLRQDKAPYNDVRVRRAISLAMDRDAIKKFLGRGTVDLLPLAWNYAFDTMPTDVSPYYKHDVAQAKQLMAAVGYANGFDMQFDYYPYGGVIYDDIAQTLQQNWAQIGIRVTLNKMEYSAWSAMYIAMKSKFNDAAWGLNEATTTFESDWLSRMDPRSPTDFNYVNDPQVNSLIDKIDAELDPTARRALYRQVWDLEATNMYRPGIPEAPGGWIAPSRVGGALPTKAEALPTFGNQAAEYVWLAS